LLLLLQCCKSPRHQQLAGRCRAGRQHKAQVQALLLCVLLLLQLLLLLLG
jgi:hypothetical protein